LLFQEVSTLIHTELQLVNLVSSLGPTPEELEALIDTDLTLTDELTDLSTHGVSVTDALFETDVADLVSIEAQLAKLLKVGAGT